MSAEHVGCPLARFDSEERAHWALRIIKRRGRGGGKLRVYECTECGGWHVGSGPA